jgi:hypothetical protein
MRKDLASRAHAWFPDSVLTIAEALPSDLLELLLAIEPVGAAEHEGHSVSSPRTTTVTRRWALTPRSAQTTTLARARCALGDPRRD